MIDCQYSFGDRLFSLFGPEDTEGWYRLAGCHTSRSTCCPATRAVNGECRGSMHRALWAELLELAIVTVTAQELC